MCPEKNVFNCLDMSCEEDIHRANMTGEMVQVRDGQLHLSMSQCEVCALVEYVCRAFYVNVAPLIRNTVSSYIYIV